MIFNLSNDKSVLKLIEFLLKNKEKSIDIKIHKETRTNRQGRSIWLYCTLLAEALSEAGLDVRILLKEDLEVSWTKDLIMDIYWRTIQKTLFDTDSTRDLKTHQVSLVYEELNRHMSKFGITVQFPDKNYKGYE